jgi:hypothetical protein
MNKEVNIKYNKILPRGTAAVVKGKLESENIILSLRTVQRILAGDCEDNHGVLEIAAGIAAEKLKQKEKLNKKYALLKLKSSHPQKHK